MRKLKILSVLMVLVLLITTPLFAQARFGLRKSRPLTSSGVFLDREGNTMNYPVWIYSISVLATAANAAFGVYDCDSTAELYGSEANSAMDEIGEATAYDDTIRTYPKPEYYTDGVAGLVVNGVAYVQYGPEP